ncbi:MAG: DHH family phosphoesterase [Acidobacteriota bacterium]
MSPEDRLDPKERVEKLREVFADAQRALVMAHDNPDPDALASAFALCSLLRQLDEIDCEVGFGGLIGRAENRAMVRELELEPVQIDAESLQKYDTIALVDTQPAFGNNSFPADRVASAVIDHHPGRGSLEQARFVDVREGYGATATIIFEYVQASGIPLSENLLTALFYAIKSETQELGREAGYADREAYLNLLPRADKAAVARIQRARVPRAYFRAFSLAIDNARVHGRTVVTDLGVVDSPDMVAEIADFLLRLEGADWAACMGKYNDGLVLSLRTAEEDAHAGSVIRKVVAGLGRAGGHGTMAGGRVPLDGGEYGEIAEQVRGRLLEVLGANAKPGEPLVAT